MPGLPIAHIPHPMASRTPARVNELAKESLDEILHILTTDARQLEREYKDKTVTSKGKLQRKPTFSDEFSREGAARAFKAPASLDAINMLFYRRGWTDGLPIVPPTEERVEKMIAHSGWDTETFIGRIPPSNGVATVEKIAINAVMAGCAPAALPVVIAAVKAMIKETFNLYALQTTTHPCTVLALISGPLADELDINAGYNAMGQGFMGNATIGRAIRMVLINIGGATPGVLDRSTAGGPQKYSFCFAENEDESPWEPFRVEMGFPESQTTVTVIGGEGPHNVNDHGGNTGKEILMTLSGVLATSGSNNLAAGGEPLIAFGPEHADVIAKDGFSKKDVKEWLFEHARVPVRRISKGNLDMFSKMSRKRFTGIGIDDAIPMVDEPDEYMVVVAGGNGRHSAIIPTFGITRSVTLPVTDKDGEPVLVQDNAK